MVTTHLTPHNTQIAPSRNGFLAVTVDDQGTHNTAFPVRLFPLTQPQHHIALVKDQDGALIELGIIDDLRQFPPEAQQLIEAELRRRAFVPEITDVIRTAQTKNLDEWEVTTDRGPKTFYVKDRRDNVVFKHGATLVMITDIDGCRYRMPATPELLKKAWLMLESVAA